MPVPRSSKQNEPIKNSDRASGRPLRSLRLRWICLFVAKRCLRYDIRSTIKTKRSWIMSRNRFVAYLFGLAVGLVGAVAIARIPTATDVSRLSDAKSPEATCPKFQWPYGCEWHPTTNQRSRHLSMRRSHSSRLYISLFGT